MAMLKIRFGEFLLDEARYVLLRGDEVVALRPKAFDLLVHLARHADRVVLREELVRAVWGGTRVGAGSLAGLVNELRRALGERGRGASVIRTVHARGYQFVGDASPCGDTAPAAAGPPASAAPAPTPAPPPAPPPTATAGSVEALAAEATSHASAIGPFGLLFEAEATADAGGLDEATSFLEACERRGFEVHRIPTRVGVAITPQRIAWAILESLLSGRSREEVAEALPLPARRWLATRSLAPVAGGEALVRLEPPGGLSAVATCVGRCAGGRPIVLLLESIDGSDEGVATALAAFFRALGTAPVVVCVAPDPTTPVESLGRCLARASGFRVFAGGDTGLQRERRTLEAWCAAWHLDAVPTAVEAALIGHLRGDRPLERAERVAADPLAAAEAARAQSATSPPGATDVEEPPRPPLRRVEPGVRVRLAEGKTR